MSDPRKDAEELVRGYYRAFGERDDARMLERVTDSIEHHVNQGEVRRGKEAFAEFLATMHRHYSERLEDLVVMADESGTRVAAEFTVHGAYRVRAEGLPPAHGQSYVLPAGAFFTLEGNRIARVTTYYNLADWIAQVEGGDA